MLVRLSLLAATLAATAPASALAQRKPIVAVFSVEDRTGLLRDDALRSLDEYLTTKVAERDAFQVIPSSQIRDRLAQERRESYAACYDQWCHIEIGRELAAQKTLATQIVRLGSRCAVLCRLYDLKRATTERSATEKASCDVDALIGALERAITVIVGKDARPGTLAPDPALTGGQAPGTDAVRRRRTKTVWGYAALSASAAMGIAAAVLYGVGISRRDEAHASYLAIQSEGRQAELDRHWSEVEAAEDKITAGHVLVSAAAVGLGIAAYLLLTRPSGAAEGKEGRLTRFVPLTRGQGLALCHRF